MAQAYTKNAWLPKGTPGAFVVTSARLNAMESGIYLASAPIVTTLPSSPVDGQEVNYLADATNGNVWHLVYRSATGKWHHTGGPALYAEVANGGNGIPSTAYGDLGTAGPSIVLPIAGTYLLEYGYSGYFSNLGNSNPRAVGSPIVGGAGPFDQNAIFMSPGMAVPAGQQHNQHAARAKLFTGITAGATAAMKFRYENQSPTLVDNRWIKATPVMVG